MIGDLIQHVLLITAALYLSGTSFYRLMLVRGAASLSYATSMTSLTVSPMWLLIEKYSGEPTSWPEIGILIAGGWLIWQTRAQWVTMAVNAESFVARPFWRLFLVSCFIVGFSSMYAALQDVQVIKDDGPKPAVQIQKLTIKDQQAGELPVLVIDANVQYVPAWAKVSVEIYEVDGISPRYSMTRESNNPKSTVGKTPPGPVKSREIPLAKPLDVKPGKYYGIYFREEIDDLGRRVVYTPLRTPVFVVS